MKYNIDGADAVTGKDRSLQVNADSEQEAVAAAKSQGVFPFRVSQAPLEVQQVSTQFQSCTNCGRKIGHLEAPHVYHDHVVCDECANRLNHQKDNATKTGLGSQNPIPNEIICPNPNCGYTGPPSKQDRGSVAVGCLLCFIMLLPGLIYFALMSGYIYVCPRCGVQIRSGTHS